MMYIRFKMRRVSKSKFVTVACISRRKAFTTFTDFRPYSSINLRIPFMEDYEELGK